MGLQRSELNRRDLGYEPGRDTHPRCRTVDVQGFDPCRCRSSTRSRALIRRTRPPGPTSETGAVAGSRTRCLALATRCATRRAPTAIRMVECLGIEPSCAGLQDQPPYPAGTPVKRTSYTAVKERRTALIRRGSRERPAFDLTIFQAPSLAEEL